MGTLVLVGGFLAGRATVLGAGSPFALAAATLLSMQGLAPSYLLGFFVAALLGVSEGGRQWLTPQVMTLAVALTLIFAGRRLARHPAVGPVWVATAATGLAGACTMVGGGFWAIQTLSGWAWVGLQAALTGAVVSVWQRGQLSIRGRRRSPELTLAWLLVGFASIAGARGLLLWQAPLDMLLGSVVVLLAGWVGGAAVGATAGVLVGVSQMLTVQTGGALESTAVSSLTFAAGGLAAGVFRELGRIPATLGYLLALGLMAYLPGQTASAPPGVWAASLVGSVLVAALPQGWLQAGYRTLFISRSDQVADHSRNGVAAPALLTLRRRILAVVRLLKEVAHAPQVDQALAETAAAAPVAPPDSFAPTAGQVVERVCRECFRYSQCWETRFFTTYSVLTEVWDSLQDPSQPPDTCPAKLAVFCPRSPEVVQVLLNERDNQHLRQAVHQQLQAARGLMAGQFHSLAFLLEQLAAELDVELAQPPVPPSIEVLCGHAGVPKKGGTVAGDSVYMGPVGTGQYMVVLCDGMGSGRTAAADSQQAVGMLRGLIDAGFALPAAVRIINAGLLLRSQAERFVTVDLAVIDPARGELHAAKLGAAPSLLVRSAEWITVAGDAPPAGIIPTVEMECRVYKLRPNDCLVMATDGFWSAMGDDGVRSVGETVNGLQHQTPQQVADVLLAHALDSSPEEPVDDTTVVTLRVHAVAGGHSLPTPKGAFPAPPQPVPVKRAPVDRALVVRHAARKG